MSSNDDWGDGGLWEEAREYAEAAASARRDIVDRFLLAVIDAHPVDGSSREQRLADAKRALLGTVKQKGRSQKDDHRLLMEMAHAYISGRCELELRIPEDERVPIDDAASIRELARDATRDVAEHNRPSLEDRLRKKFASEKRHYIQLALHSLERDEIWDNTQIDEVLKALRLSGAESMEEPREF